MHSGFAIRRVSTSPLGRYRHGIITGMISDQDIEKLKEVFPTLEVTDRLEQKIDNLEGRFDGLETRFDGLETRFDGLEVRFDGLETRFDGLEVRFDGLEEQVGDLRVEVGELHDKFDSMESKIDGLVGLVHASLEEHGAGAAHLVRHDHQIAELAAHVGVTLSS